MELEVVTAQDPSDVDRAARSAAEVLARGGVVVHPTETVYGIGGDGSAESNELIRRLKGRASVQPLLLLIPDLATLRATFAQVEWPDEAEELAGRFWPGPLTLVVRCPAAPPGLKGPNEGLAVRVSSHPLVKVLLRRWGRPMTSTSANLSGRPPARTLEEALRLFRGRWLESVDRPLLALDGGPLPETLPSTVVSFVEAPPRLIREGPVRREELERWLGVLK